MSPAGSADERIVEGSTPAARWWTRARFMGLLWALMLPSLLGLAVFTYYPNLDAIRYAFYDWNGGTRESPNGLTNFRDIFTADPLFWKSFGLIGILLVANLVKMWPSIFAAIVLHRLKSDRWQYIFRVLFVIPMVIPGLVWLLIWKGFFDPTVGILNQVLNLTGLMSVLRWADTAMPAVAAVLNSTWSPLSWFVQPVFGSLWGLALFGLVLLMLRRGTGQILHLWMVWLLVLGLGVLAWGSTGAGLSPMIAAIRGPLLLAAAHALAGWSRRSDPHDGVDRTTWWGWGCIFAAAGLILLSQVWTAPTDAFTYGAPSWLGHSKLAIPAVILWGFPWVGTVGVLIYLAGLQNISKEVYEAAELDGVGFWGKIFRIEVPLILTQIRINLIFMTIGTLGEFGFFLILFGDSGGPDNAALTPGLYMYQKAFFSGQYGYACALGMIMCLLILYITIIYQRHVKVDK